MDEISKEVDEWYIPLNIEGGCQYYFKGHELNQEKIKHYLKEEYGEDLKEITFTETWAHWGMAHYDGENQRWLFPSKKYKGIRGGFKVTEVELMA